MSSGSGWPSCCGPHARRLSRGAKPSWMAVAIMPPNKEVGPRDTTPEGTDTIITTPATTTATSTVQCSGTQRQCSTDTRTWWRRRRAADRCEPNASGVRDPWQPWRPEKLSEKQIDAAAAAAAHLLGLGY